MVTCEICGAVFKNTQGLAGHRRLRHTDQKPGFALTGHQLYRRVLQRLADKLAERLANGILEAHGQELLESCLEELHDQGLAIQPLDRRQTVRAIIVAAGQSSRLFPLTSDRPGCLLDVGNKTILEKELDTLQGCGISHIAVVRGYQREKIDYPQLRYYENIDYENNGILKSLFCAEGEINDEFVFLYSDIIYRRGVLERLLQDKADISLIVDTEWISHYHQRYQHSLEEAELTMVEGNRIERIGKNIIDPGRAHGEFIGLAKFTRRGAEILKSSYARALNEYSGIPFHNAPSVEKAYFTDMIQEIIDQGYIVHNVDIQGGWAEIDTLEDLEKARMQFQQS